MKKRILAAVLAAVALGSCGEAPVVHEQVKQTEITLSWWGNDTRNEYTIEAMQRFEELHPEIKVKCNYSEWSGYEARSKVQMISGTEADVMQINVGWLTQYSEDGQGYYDIEKLTDIVDLTGFSEEILSYGRRNGVLNAVPIAMNAETLYINKTIYDRYGLDIPKTWDDLFKAAEVMKGDSVFPVAAASKSIWLYLIAYAEQQNGREIFNENSEICFKPEDFQLMIEFYNRLVTEDVIPKVEDYQRFNIDNGKYAGAVAWVSDAMNYYSGLTEEGIEIVAAPYTVFDGTESGTGWYAKPATLYAVSKNTEHPKEAAILLDFLLNSTQMAELQGVEKGIPISSSAREYLKEHGMLDGLQYEASQVMETNKLIKHMDPLIENSDLYEEFLSACDLVLFDKASAEEAAQQLYDTYKEKYKMAQ